MLALWHDCEGVIEGGLAAGFLARPYLVEGAAGDTPSEMGVELQR